MENPTHLKFLLCKAWCLTFQLNFQKNCYSVKNLCQCILVIILFWGPNPHGLCKKKSIAMLLWDTLIELGRITNTNMNVKKCKGPAKCLDILGFGSIPIKKSLFCARSMHKKDTNVDKNHSLIISSHPRKLLKLLWEIWCTMVGSYPTGDLFISHISYCIDRK